MSDLLLIAGAVAVVVLLTKKGETVSFSFSARPSADDTIPTASSISGGPIVSGGYQVAPPAAQLGGQASATTSVSLPTYDAPATFGPPPPDTVGGAGGTAGTGGRPLGAFRLGLSPVLTSSVTGVATAIARGRIPRTGRRSPFFYRVPVVSA